MPWKNLKIRQDTWDHVARAAALNSRSVSGQADFLLRGALLDPFDEDDFKENSTASEWQATLEDPPSPQTDIYEMLAGCPECAGRMESVGDGPQRCVDCGFTREER
jgi:hypothetical protein